MTEAQHHGADEMEWVDPQDLMVNMPGRKQDDYKRGEQLKEKKLKHAMTYLGLKDT